MKVHVFEGASREMGRQYGETLADRIRRNLSILVWREGYEPLPRGQADFESWIRDQERLIGDHWPWMLEEMRGIAQGVGVDYADILLLNLRAWQFNFYGAKPEACACSSLAITLDDGTVAAAGALDDPPDLYCGPVLFATPGGHRLLTFPISGTVWGNRGINSAGLTVGISSQILPGLARLPHAVNQDLATRAIYQTCTTVDDVRRFCQKHPFTMNLVCVDARGGILCLQHTAAGPFELPVTDGWCALTNHVADDGFLYWLTQHGVKEFPESPTTRARRGRLLAFARERNGRCSPDEVRQFLCRRDDTDPGTIHNRGTLALTYANPQAHPHRCWVAGPGEPLEPVDVPPG
ncbi:MAG: C45 family autoproteolytic acyltransferase/hydrolase [Kiritimatiellae bacterium]|nr:C45 family autoproteolytic acyltransferase/hydrolase [Kiritimatiellia bacterium]